MRPRASKNTQNHENLVTQNQENPRKKRLQEMARWRVMRAAHWIYIRELIIDVSEFAFMGAIRFWILCICLECV